MYPIHGFSLRWYEAFFTNGRWMDSLKSSMIVAPAATLLATVLGTVAAVGLTSAGWAGQSFMMTVLISPMVVATRTHGGGASAWAPVILCPLGLANSYLGIGGEHAPPWATPFVVITVSATLRREAGPIWCAPAQPWAAARCTPSSASPCRWSRGRDLRRPVLPLPASFDEVVVTLFLAGSGTNRPAASDVCRHQEAISPTIAAARAAGLVLPSCCC